MSAVSKNRTPQHVNNQNIDNQIVHLIQQYLIADKNDQFDSKGQAYLLERVQHFTTQQEKLQLILPGFPCKSPNNIDKSFSAAPDYGEVMAIERLDDLCTQLNKIYSPGSELTILSDGTTFSDIVHVSEEAKEHYKNSLRNITITENIAWADLSTMFSFNGAKTATSENKRKELLKSIAKGPRSFENFIKRVKNNPAEAAAHDRMCSFLYSDMNLERFSEGNRDKYLESISEKAYQMMYRGKALETSIKQAFPHHLRLSVHQYDNSGPKFTFNFSSNHHKAIAPWHSVPVRLLNGEFIQLPHSIAKERLLAKVTYQQQNWFYLEVEKPELAELHYEVVKGPKFGLQISNPQKLAYSFSTSFLQKLSEDFGFLIIKNAPIKEQIDLVGFCKPFGDIYEWKFGPVHVVKPKAVPDGFVHSIEKTPLHWDLSMLPANDPNVIKNPRFAATTFMLYCKVPPAKGEGQTTIVDSRMALKIAGQKKVEEWKKVNITYETKMTYFGGDPHTYPLVFEHPTNKDEIFRYQEGSELEMQKFLLSNDKYSKADFDNLVQELNDLAYDERCLIKHEWEAGDLVVIDNLYTLHGRLAMTEKSMARELWRVQVS